MNSSLIKNLLKVILLFTCTLVFSSCFNNYTDTNLTEDLIKEKVNKLKEDKEFLESEKREKLKSYNTLNELSSALEKIKEPAPNEVSKFITENYLDSTLFEDVLDHKLLTAFLFDSIQVIMKNKGIEKRIYDPYTQTNDNAIKGYSLSTKMDEIYNANITLPYKEIVIINQRFIENKANRFSGFYNLIRNNFVNSLKNESNNLQNMMKKDSTDLSSNTDLYKDYEDEYSELKTQSVNRLIIVYILPGFAILLLALFFIPRVFKDPELVKSIFENGLLLQVITIYLLIGTIILLSLGKIIDKEVVGTLLGGISVYVLQRAAERSKKSEVTEIINEFKKNDENKNETNK